MMLGLWVLGLTGCLEDSIFFSGVVFDDYQEDASPVSEAEVRIYDALLDLSHALTAGEDGSFGVDMASGSHFYLNLSGEGFHTTAISGSAGYTDFDVSNGELWMVSDETMDQLEADFAGCPSIGEEGGVVFGETRIAENNGSGTITYTYGLSWVQVYDSEGNIYPACYLVDDLDQVTYDPTADFTGLWGRFAVFGVPTGPLTVEWGYNIVHRALATFFLFTTREYGLSVHPHNH